MKRTFLIIFSLIIIFSLAACGEATSGDAFADEKCDLDMAKMNNTMAYSQLTNIYKTPDEYLGKIIKIKGTFQIYKGAQDYYVCEISDNTACCSAGMEFVLKDEPDAYPPLGTEITVLGKFETYKETGQDGKEQTYCHLVDAKLA